MITEGRALRTARPVSFDMAKPPPRPTFFATPTEFRRWLERYHDSKDELWVGFHKKATGRPSLTWPESVDEALCFGWIDGIRKTVDEASAKKEETRQGRLDTLIKECAAGRRLGQAPRHK